MNLDFPNYTGPYISDGKFQESVVFGTVSPKDELDALSRLHDTAYATFKDKGHRTAADAIYKSETDKLNGLVPTTAGNAVLFGNAIGRSATNLISGIAQGPGGLIYKAVQNMLSNHDYMLNEKKYKKDVLDLYSKDPSISKKVETKSPVLEEQAFAAVYQPPIRGKVVMPLLYQSENETGTTTKYSGDSFYLHEKEYNPSNDWSLKRRRRRKKKNRIYVY